MTKYIKFIISFICLIFISCSENDSILKNELKSFIGQEIQIPEELVPINLPENITKEDILKAKHKIFIYVDSVECSECKIKAMIPWQQYIKKYNYRKLPVIIVFNVLNVSDLMYNIKLHKINFPYFIDGNNSFKEMNPHLPTSETLKTFFTKNNKVILAGNPINNVKMDQLYKRIIQEIMSADSCSLEK